MASVDWKVEVDFNWSGDVATAPATWTDISAYVLGLHVDQTRTSPLERFPPRQAVITLDNATSLFDALNTAGTYYPKVLPNRAVRVTALSGSVVVFYGIADGWAPSFVAGYDSTVTLTATDGFKAWAALDIANPQTILVVNPVRGAETTGARVTALGGVGDTTGLALNAETVSGKFLEYFSAVAEHESGHLWCDPNSASPFRPTFRDRQYRFLSARSTASQMSIGDTNAQDSEYDALEVSFDDADSFSFVRVTKADATNVYVTTGLGIIGKTLDRTLLTSVANDATDIANYLGGVYGVYATRVKSVVLRPGTQATAAPVMGLRLHDRVTIVRTPAVGSAWTQQCWVEGITYHAEGGASDTTVTLTLSLADSRSFWLLDTSVLDTSTLLGF